MSHDIFIQLKNPDPRLPQPDFPFAIMIHDELENFIENCVYILFQTEQLKLKMPKPGEIGRSILSDKEQFPKYTVTSLTNDGITEIQKEDPQYDLLYKLGRINILRPFMAEMDDMQRRFRTLWFFWANVVQNTRLAMQVNGQPINYLEQLKSFSELLILLMYTEIGANQPPNPLGFSVSQQFIREQIIKPMQLDNWQPAIATIEAQSLLEKYPLAPSPLIQSFPLSATEQEGFYGVKNTVKKEDYIRFCKERTIKNSTIIMDATYANLRSTEGTYGGPTKGSDAVIYGEGTARVTVVGGQIYDVPSSLSIDQSPIYTAMSTPSIVRMAENPYEATDQFAEGARQAFASLQMAHNPAMFASAVGERAGDPFYESIYEVPASYKAGQDEWIIMTLCDLIRGKLLPLTQLETQSYSVRRV